MVIPKTDDDLPPAYDNTTASGSRVNAPVEKGSTRVPLSPTASSSVIKPRTAPKSSWTALGDDMGNLLADVGLGSAQRRVAQEVRKTVTGLIHDLVRDQTIDSNISCVGILESCSEACSTHSIDMSGLLQQSYIEGHTPLYWAIVQRPSDGPEPTSFETPPLIRTLLAYSAPLKDSTINDVRLACLHTCDQWLFQSIRLCPEFRALSNKEQLLLGVQVPPDIITVGLAARHDAPFTIDFEFTNFQKRMRVSAAARLDFISHARMWEIAFFVADWDRGLTAGQWAVRLGLRDNSPPTNVSATYIIDQHSGPEEDPLESVSLALSGKLTVDTTDMHAALPDAVQYPRSPFLTADGKLRGRLTIQITNK
ncbi:hypothetical protein C8R43DRAFT_1235487 [Mycena crocata]|nr:hypothetical protein C8R43DRAFT_1235487 [Mycena crocata]